MRASCSRQRLLRGLEAARGSCCTRMRATRRRAERRAEDRPSSPSSRSTAGLPPGRRGAGASGDVRQGVVAQGLAVADRLAGAPAGSRWLRRTASSAPRRARRPRRSHAPMSPGPTPAMTRPSDSTSSAASVLARGTGPRSATSDDRRRQLHGAGSVDHGGQGRRAVQPRRLKQEVVVGGHRGEAALPRGVDGAR